MSPVPRNLTLLVILIFAAVLFFTGINWGLPSRESDSFLFGGQPPWTGKQIIDLAGAWDSNGSRGADVAMHILQRRDAPVVLNDTDAKRAEIVRRYRLYSNQPDEMITFRSLSGMKPGQLDFDPKVYQYGGLWIYPIGVLLKLAGALHLIVLRTDLAFYLDYPEAFGRFYLLARCYAAAWGLMGVLVVYAVGREWSGHFFAGAAAAAVYTSMPVVIDLAHEAKPHLPGTVLTLLAVFAGMRYVRTGGRRWWILAGGFAGAAMGMVLTGYAAFAVLPVMALLRPMPWLARIRITAYATLIGIAIFTLTNPYLPLNLLFRRGVLHSNVGNSLRFYPPAASLSGLAAGGRSLLDGASFAPLLIGLLGAVIAFRRKTPGLGLAAVSAPVLFQLVLLGAGKPAEYGRFGLTVDVVLAILAAGAIDRLPISGREKTLAAALLVATTLFFGMRYDINFVLDNRSDSTRRATATSIQSAERFSNVLAVFAEPAPYCLPPVDLFHWRIMLQPPGTGVSGLPPGTTLVRPIDIPKTTDPLAMPLVASPISWANKPFEILKFSPVSSPVTRP